jgi:hypothetical protein
MNNQNGVILKRDSNNITISEFYENEILNKYNYDPNYQRKGDVWSTEKKAFLIDSILKNYPIPPIFLHSETNSLTGKTIYHVIDGKQRLSAIIKFINDELYLPESFGDDNYGTAKLNGLKFSEIDPESPYKKNFWKYRIPIEYVDSEDEDVINRIFDRLNRNGEPLNKQELRNARYSQTDLMKMIRNLNNIQFWQTRLKNVVEVSRMEDEEFISELLFTMLEEIIDAKPETLDSLYTKWVDSFQGDDNAIKSTKREFKKITTFLESLDINYNEHKVQGVSHLYGLWGFSISCIKKSINPKDVKDLLDQFFRILRDNSLETKSKDQNIAQYKDSMSYNTKSKGQRIKRINSLLNYCGIKSVTKPNK